MLIVKKIFIQHFSELTFVHKIQFSHQFNEKYYPQMVSFHWQSIIVVAAVDEKSLCHPLLIEAECLRATNMMNMKFIYSSNHFLTQHNSNDHHECIYLGFKNKQISCLTNYNPLLYLELTHQIEVSGTIVIALNMEKCIDITKSC